MIGCRGYGTSRGQIAAKRYGVLASDVPRRAAPDRVPSPASAGRPSGEIPGSTPMSQRRGRLST